MMKTRSIPVCQNSRTSGPARTGPSALPLFDPPSEFSRAALAGRLRALAQENI